MLYALSWNFICQLYLCKAGEKCLMRRKALLKPKNKRMRHILEHEKKPHNVTYVYYNSIQDTEVWGHGCLDHCRHQDSRHICWEIRTNQLAPNRRASAEWHLGVQWVLVGCAEEYKRHWKPAPMPQSGWDPEQDSHWGLGSVLCTAKSWARVPSPT